MTNLDNQTIWREACAAALVSLSGMGPMRLQAFLADAPPETVWDTLADAHELPVAAVQACGPGYRKLLQTWRKEVKSIDPLDVLERYQQQGVSIWTHFTSFPARLIADPYSPAVLFAQGNRGALDRSTVAIIGTRRASQEGRAIARRFGCELAESGVAVLSGLALGIDGAAHQGSLQAAFGAPPIAVVGSGLNRVYPKQHASLWDDVRQRGLLISEAPLDAPPEAWRFPARNRILAGLADVVVVIESHERGGSLITVDEALSRGKSVMAVPGSIQNPSAVGSNRLLMDSIPPVCSTEDILQELMWQNETAAEHQPGFPEPNKPVQPPLLAGSDAMVLEAVDWSPTSTDDVILRTGLPMGEVVMSLARLEAFGCILRDEGWWQRQAAGWL